MAGESSCKYICSICRAMPPPSKCTAKFCSKCGKPLVLIPVDLHEKQERVPQQRKCVACQKELEPDENFCGDCGKPANETKSPTNQTPEGNATGRSPQDTVEHAIDPESEKRLAINHSDNVFVCLLVTDVLFWKGMISIYG